MVRPPGITMLVEAVGTPADQFPALFQSVDELPVQVDVATISPMTKSPKLMTDVACIDVARGEATLNKDQLDPL